MQWSDVGKVVGAVAPTVGTLLGGPAGAAIGALVSTALGTDNNPAAVNAALTADPQLVYKLKELQENNQADLQKLMITAATEQFKAEVEDRDSARKLAAVQPNDWIRPTFAVSLLFGFFAIVAYLLVMNTEIPTQLAVLIGALIGTWQKELQSVSSFYFGTTKNANEAAAVITDFAVKDGTVTSTK